MAPRLATHQLPDDDEAAVEGVVIVGESCSDSFGFSIGFSDEGFLRGIVVIGVVTSFCSAAAAAATSVSWKNEPAI